MDAVDDERVRIIESKSIYEKIGEKLFDSLEEDNIIDKTSITTDHRRTDIKKIDLLSLYPKIDKLGRDKATNEFTHLDRTFLLLSFYLFLCENIKNIFTHETYEKIFDKLPEKPFDKKLIKRHVQLSLAIQILEKYIEYKSISPTTVFDVIDVDLRNSIAHNTFEDGEDFLKYYTRDMKEKNICGEEMIHKILYAAVIFSGIQDAKMNFYVRTHTN